MFSLESPHRGDSYEYTQYTIFNIKKKVTLNYPKSAAMRFFQGTEERVRNRCVKRAISVRATERLLCCLEDKERASCFVVNLVTANNFAPLFNCMPVGRSSDSMIAPT